MVACRHCGAALEFPRGCRYCDGGFCPAHRLPERHDCPGVRGWERRGGRFESGFAGFRQGWSFDLVSSVVRDDDPGFRGATGEALAGARYGRAAGDPSAVEPPTDEATGAAGATAATDATGPVRRDRPPGRPTRQRRGGRRPANLRSVLLGAVLVAGALYLLAGGLRRIAGRFGE